MEKWRTGFYVNNLSEKGRTTALLFDLVDVFPAKLRRFSHGQIGSVAIVAAISSFVDLHHIRSAQAHSTWKFRKPFLNFHMEIEALEFRGWSAEPDLFGAEAISGRNRKLFPHPAKD